MHSNRSRALATGLLLGLLALSPLGGCQTLGYYAHVTRGQLEVLGKRTPVTRVMAELEPRRADDAEADLRYRRLAYTQEVLDFAERELGFRVGRRYRSFVDLDRPAVVWNVFAAPALSLSPHQWCYPIVGCAPYRGFFDVAPARRQADRLADQGLDVYVGPVSAYSTLGWFADPLLSTFIDLPEPALAELLLHELAHGEVWVPGDVAFNESFATFVGRQAAAAWRGEPAGEHDPPADDQGPRLRMLSLLAQTRAALSRVYQGPLSEQAKLERKRALLAAAVACHDANRALLGGGRYADLVSGLNNARLAAITTYEDLVPAFAGLFQEVGGDWTAFLKRVRALADLPAEVRVERLRASADQQIAAAGDDQGADEVQCHAFFRHLLDGEAVGGVDDDVGRGGHRQHEGA